NFDDFPEELVRLLLARARVLVAKVVVVVLPVGYGTNMLGCDHGFSELLRRGEIDRMPRLFGVQASNCAPYYAAFQAGVEHLVPTPVAPTIAEGIASSKPTRIREVIATVRAYA